MTETRADAKRRCAALLPLMLITCCGGGGTEVAEPASSAPNVISVTSDALVAGAPIPRRFTCDGAGESPALTWSGVPAKAESVALVVDDPDAPGGTYVHWVVLDVPVADGGVAAGAEPDGGVPVRNSSGTQGYAPPCPPSGTHHYRFTVYALSSPTGLQQDAGLDEALRAIGAHALAQGRLVATYTHTG